MRRRMRAERAIALVSCLVTVGLVTAACGGGPSAGTLGTDEPTDAVVTAGPDDSTKPRIPTPTTESPATTEPSDNPTVPATSQPPGPAPPEAATAPTRAGAKAFARFYVEQLNAGYAYGDVAGMLAHSTPDCQLCREYADEYATIARNGGWVRGDPTWRVDTVLVEKFAVDHSELVVLLTIGEHSYADSALDPEQHAPERSYEFAFDLRHDGERWLVTGARATTV